MIVQHIAAFSSGSHGGNPAGVVLCEEMPEPAVMQKLAAEVGYSESEVEVDFCGHATIALGAARGLQLVCSQSQPRPDHRRGPPVRNGMGSIFSIAADTQRSGVADRAG